MAKPSSKTCLGVATCNENLLVHVLFTFQWELKNGSQNQLKLTFALEWTSWKLQSNSTKPGYSIIWKYTTYLEMTEIKVKSNNVVIFNITTTGLDRVNFNRLKKSVDEFLGSLPFKLKLFSGTFQRCLHSEILDFSWTSMFHAFRSE